MYDEVASWSQNGCSPPASGHRLRKKQPMFTFLHKISIEKWQACWKVQRSCLQIDEFSWTEHIHAINIQCWWLVAKSFPTHCNLDCSALGSSVYGISQVRMLEWFAISFSEESSWPGDWTQVSCIAGNLLHCKQILFTNWGTWRNKMWFNFPMVAIILASSIIPCLSLLNSL